MALTRREFGKFLIALLGAPMAQLAGARGIPVSLLWDKTEDADLACVGGGAEPNVGGASTWRMRLFDDDATEGPATIAYDDADWAVVVLPHWGRLERYNVSITYQGFCWYRRYFAVDPAVLRRGRVTLRFGAGMQVADVWVNGVHSVHHEGGYLPFMVDLTDALRAGAALVAVRLDSKNNPAVPPGKPLQELDFCYYSGLYRDARLYWRPDLHITDAITADVTGGGGVFFRCLEASAQHAKLLVNTQVRNDSAQASTFKVGCSLYDTTGKLVANAMTGMTSCDSGQSSSTDQIMVLQNPQLWSPEDPNLYGLVVRVMEGERIVDAMALRVGIRWLVNDPFKGFFLNGQHRVPYGANRHQEYPYIGNAASDEAQYREARRLKAAGFDLIRLSHYPQSSAFMDACDELGLMVIECMAGWQHFDDSEQFRSNVRQGLKDAIHRDRNHPCAVLWEATLNETPGHDHFFRSLVELANAEYPGGQMLTCGDTMGHNYKVIGYNVPYTGWDQATHTRPDLAGGEMSLNREYGDNQFGPFSRYGRSDGEYLMLVQCWNYQTALNQQLQLSYTWGNCTWEAIDNNRGLSKNIEKAGCLDEFRLPKFLYFFFQSQRNPNLVSDVYESGPMVFIANYWTPSSPRNVVVFSNADEIQLSINGRQWGKQKPDDGPDVPFGDQGGFSQSYWLHRGKIPTFKSAHKVPFTIYNGGNCRALPRAPFTFFDVPFDSGELRAEALIGGRVVATHVRRTPGMVRSLRLTVDLQHAEFASSGADVVFVHATAVDVRGTPVPGYSGLVTFRASGPAEIIGDNPRAASAGIASVILRSTTSSGKVVVEATAAKLGSVQVEVASKPPVESRVPGSARRWPENV